MSVANKIIPVVDGTPGPEIQLQDARLAISLPNDGDILIYDDVSETFINQAPFDNNTIPTAQCSSGNDQVKVAHCTNYSLKDPSYLVINLITANSYNGKITLNVNNTGAKDIYINGTVSSSSNNTLPAGMYIAYYADNKFYFRTDGKLTINGGAFGRSYNELTDTPAITDLLPSMTGNEGYVLAVNSSENGVEWVEQTGGSGGGGGGTQVTMRTWTLS